MRLKQFIISVFLLFVYSFGFAHSMMHHEHGFYSEHQPESHNHEHHNHTSTSTNDTVHLHHNDHCDEGIVDLILCVLHDIHEHNNDCEDEHLIFENSKRLTSTTFNNSDTQFVSNFNSYSKTINPLGLYSKSIDFEIHNTYKALFQDCSPLRGPPVKFI